MLMQPLPAQDAMLCMRAIYRSYSAMDRQDYAAVLQELTQDCLWLRPGRSDLHGHAEVLATLERRPIGRVSAHLITNIEISHAQASGEVTADYIILVYLHDRPPADAGTVPPIPQPELISLYRDVLVKAGDGWKIARRSSTPKFSGHAS